MKHFAFRNSCKIFQYVVQWRNLAPMDACKLKHFILLLWNVIHKIISVSNWTILFSVLSDFRTIGLTCSRRKLRRPYGKMMKPFKNQCCNWIDNISILYQRSYQN